jgi:hypothetical protein
MLLLKIIQGIAIDKYPLHIKVPTYKTQDYYKHYAASTLKHLSPSANRVKNILTTNRELSSKYLYITVPCNGAAVASPR